jgi:hypothetical protein
MRKGLFVAMTVAVLGLGTWAIVSYATGSSDGTDVSRQGPAAQQGSPSSSGEAKLKELQELLVRQAYKGRQGAVTVEVLLATPPFFQALAEMEGARQKKDPAAILASYSQEYRLEDNLVFLVFLNTHSVDLTAYKLETLSTLKEAGGATYQALGWRENEGGSSHHRSGALLFPKRGQDGQEILARAKAIELVIRDIDNVPERAFRWELPISYPSGL